jgi:hypothetical protein
LHLAFEHVGWRLALNIAAFVIWIGLLLWSARRRFANRSANPS